jgi:hypothetical protein
VVRIELGSGREVTGIKVDVIGDELILQRPARSCDIRKLKRVWSGSLK